MADFYKLTVKEVKRETPEAVSVVFNVPDSLKDFYKFTAGQYVNLKLTLDGQEIRRAYSICSNPYSGELRIAIKERSEEHTSELQSRENLVCRLLLEKKKER